MAYRVESPPPPAAVVAQGMTDANWDQPRFLTVGQLTVHTRMPTLAMYSGPTTLDIPTGPALDVEELDVDDPLTGLPMTVGELMERRLVVDGLLVFHDGGVRYETYRNGMGPTDRHLNHSTSKTLFAMLFAIAVEEGRVALDEPVGTYAEAVRGLQAWERVTVQHVLDMSVGVRSDEHYEDPDSMYCVTPTPSGTTGVPPCGGSERSHSCVRT